ncbi:MAG: hypothetical protein WCK27_02900 [Verrucomicrobiota bacterium]
MSFFLITSGQDLESLDLDHYEIPLLPLGKSCLKRARIREKGLRISVAITCDAVGKLYQGDSFGLELDDVLVVVFGWCIEYIGGEPRHFDKQSARRLVDRLIARNYEAAGLDGNYCLLAYTRKTGAVSVSGNYWTSYGFYYDSSSKCVAVSNRSAVIADIFGCSIDGIAYLSLLRSLPLPPERTLFTGVRNRLPGECLLIHAGSQTITSLRRPLVKPESTAGGCGPARARDEIAQIVVASCSDPGTLVDLTGGQNTRVTAAILSQHTWNIPEYGLTFKTVGEEDDLDVMLARKIARLYGWNHLVISRNSATDYDWDRFRLCCLLLDGSTLPDEVSLQRLFREAKLCERFPVLVGSWGGEFFRDHFFLPEYALRIMGVTKDVSGYFMTRARPTNEIEVTRISRGAFTISSHDEVYLTTYRQWWGDVDGPLADKLNGLAALRATQKRRDNWAFAAFRRTILPNTTDRAYATAVSLSVGSRMFNQFVSGLICAADERLGAIPTDRGAILQPLTVRSIGTHMEYYLKELARMIRGKLLTQKGGQTTKVTLLPKSWEDRLDLTDPFYEYPTTLKAKRPDPKDHCELLCLLMLECMQNHYRNIRREIDFTP